MKYSDVINEKADTVYKVGDKIKAKKGKIPKWIFISGEVLALTPFNDKNKINVVGKDKQSQIVNINDIELDK